MHGRLRRDRRTHHRRRGHPSVRRGVRSHRHGRGCARRPRPGRRGASGRCGGAAHVGQSHRVAHRRVAHRSGRRPGGRTAGAVAPPPEHRRPDHPRRCRHRGGDRRAATAAVRERCGGHARALVDLARRHRSGARRGRRHRVPGAAHAQPALPAARRPVLQRCTDRDRPPQRRRTRELRRRARGQVVRGRTTRDRTARRHRRPVAAGAAADRASAERVRGAHRRRTEPRQHRSPHRRRLPGARRCAVGRRADQLHLPLHVARVPAADHRVRVQRGAALSGGLDAAATVAGRAGRTRSRCATSSPGGHCGRHRRPGGQP